MGHNGLKIFVCLFVTEEILYHSGLRSRELGQVPADGTLCCWMFPAGKDAISQHLAVPGVPHRDHTIGKLSSLCSEV